MQEGATVVLQTWATAGGGQALTWPSNSVDLIADQHLGPGHSDVPNVEARASFKTAVF